MRLLLEWNNVYPDTADKSGRTAFSWAAGNGHENIAGTLLQRNNAHPDTVDESGQAQFPSPTGSGLGRVVPAQAMSHDLRSRSELEEELSGPLTTDPSTLSSPPLKKIRRL